MSPEQIDLASLNVQLVVWKGFAIIVGAVCVYLGIIYFHLRKKASSRIAQLTKKNLRYSAELERRDEELAKAHVEQSDVEFLKEQYKTLHGQYTELHATATRYRNERNLCEQKLVIQNRAMLEQTDKYAELIEHVEIPLLTDSKVLDDV